jgi:hypothetical protein
MKDIIKELGLSRLNNKQKAIVVYFVISFCLIGSIAESPIWFLILLVLNFANAARLVRKVPLPDIED